MLTTITDRQVEIIGAAGKILSSEGVRGLTTKKIAQEMRFSEAALYRHFSGKEAIIIGMLHYIASEMGRRYILLELDDLDPEERLKVIFNEQFTFFNENPHFAVAVFSDGLLAEDKGINEAIHNIMKVKMTHLRPIFKAGRKDGSFTTEVSADRLMHVVMGAVRLEMFKWRSAQFDYDIKRKGNQLIRSLITLIKNTRPC